MNAISFQNWATLIAILTFQFGHAFGQSWDSFSDFADKDQSECFYERDIHSCIEATSLLNRDGRDLFQHYLRYFKNGELTLDEAYYLQSLLPKGFKPLIHKSDLINDQVIATLYLYGGIVLKEAIIEPLFVAGSKNPLTSIAANTIKETYNIHAPSLNETYDSIRFAAIRNAVDHIFARSAEVYSKDHFLNKSINLRQFLYRESFGLIRDHWDSFSAPQKSNYLLALFSLTENRLTAIENDFVELSNIVARNQSKPFIDGNELKDTLYAIPNSLQLLSSDLRISLSEVISEVDFEIFQPLSDSLTEIHKIKDDYQALINKENLNSLSEAERIVEQNKITIEMYRIRRGLKEAESQIQGMAALFSLINPEIGYTVNQFYQAQSLMLQGLTHFVEAESIGAAFFTGAGPIVAGISILQSIFADSRDAAAIQQHAMLVNLIGQMSRQLNIIQMTIERNAHLTNQKIDDVQNSINKLHKDMIQEFQNVRRDLHQMSLALSTISERTNATYQLVLEMAQNQQLKEFNDLERSILNRFKRNTSGSIRYFTIDEVTQHISFISDFVVVHARSSALTGNYDVPREDFALRVLEDRIPLFPSQYSILGYHYINYFMRSYASMVRPAIAEPKYDTVLSPLPNPSLWIDSVKLVNYLLVTHSQHFKSEGRFDEFIDRNRDAIEDLISQGENIQRFLTLLQEDFDYQPIINSLKKNYEGYITNLSTTIGSEISKRAVEQSKRISSKVFEDYLHEIRLSPSTHGKYVTTLRNMSEDRFASISHGLQTDIARLKALAYVFPDYTKIIDDGFFPVQNNYPILHWPGVYDKALARFSEEIIPREALVLEGLGVGMVHQSYFIRGHRTNTGISCYQDNNCNNPPIRFQGKHFDIVYQAKFVPFGESSERYRDFYDNDQVEGFDLAEVVVRYSPSAETIECHRYSQLANLELLKNANDPSKSQTTYRVDGGSGRCRVAKVASQKTLHDLSTDFMDFYEKSIKSFVSDQLEFIVADAEKQLYQHATSVRYKLAIAKGFYTLQHLQSLRMDGSVGSGYHSSLLSGFMSLENDPVKLSSQIFRDELAGHISNIKNLSSASIENAIMQFITLRPSLNKELRFNNIETLNARLQAKRNDKINFDLFQDWDENWPILQKNFEIDPIIESNLLFLKSLFRSDFVTNIPNLSCVDYIENPAPSNFDLEKYYCDANSGRFKLIESECPRGYTFDESIGSCSPKTCENGLMLGESQSKTVTGGVLFTKCDATGKVSDTYSCDLSKYTTTANGCIPKNCDRYRIKHGDGIVERVGFPSTNINKICEYGDLVEVGRTCDLGYELGRDRLCRGIECDKGKRYPEEWIVKSISGCVETTQHFKCELLKEKVIKQKDPIRPDVVRNTCNIDPDLIGPNPGIR